VTLSGITAPGHAGTLVAALLYDEKSPWVIPGFSLESTTVAVLEKFRSVLPSPSAAGVFVDRLLLRAAEGPFFDNFLLWFERLSA
jgi:hypothetical protein